MSDEAVTGSDLASKQVEEEARTAHGIYGLIVGSAVMAAAHGEAVGRLAVAVLITLFIYWVAERYAHIMARRTVLRRRLTRPELRRELSHGWELVTASYLPLIVLVGTRLLGAGLTGSVLSALVCSTVLLCLSGWRVGGQAQLGLAQRLVSMSVAGAFGVVMIALKSLLH